MVPEDQKERSHGDPHTLHGNGGRKGASGKESTRICGLRKKIFFIVLGIVLLVVAGIFAGVTGGILGTRSKSGSVRGSVSLCCVTSLLTLRTIQVFE